MPPKKAKTKKTTKQPSLLYLHHHWFVDDQKKLIVLKVSDAGPTSKQDMGYFDAISYKVKQSVKNSEGKLENRPTFTFSVGKKKALITLQAHFALKKPQLCEKNTTFSLRSLASSPRLQRATPRLPRVIKCKPRLNKSTNETNIMYFTAELRKLVTEDSDNEESDGVKTNMPNKFAFLRLYLHNPTFTVHL